MTARIAQLLFLVALLGGCTSPAPDPRVDDIPTKGDVLILAEEDFRSVLEAQVLAFENIYAEAHVRLRYLPQAELLKAMMSDSVRAVFTTCLPGAEQETYFRTRSLSRDVVPVLTDGIAVVTANLLEAKSVSVDSIRSGLTGAGRHVVVFDGTGTGVVRTVVDSLFGGDQSALRAASAVPGVDSLVHLVATSPGIVGLLAFSRISDLDDPRCRALRANVSLCAVSPSGDGPAVMPNQSTLADGSYPLRRTLYAVVTEGRSGLGTGFVSFVAGHKGQRIILKSGLAPIRVPAREVEILN
jgi:phosphate transport system substrate-binding protein